jgi:hypothetical protein
VTSTSFVPDTRVSVLQDGSAPRAESERNRILRRADWHFLLPNPWPDRVLCVGGSDLCASCAVIAGSTDQEPQPDVAYDLVAAEDPDDATLRILARSMGTDGACYVELRSVGPGGVGRLLRRLESAGFRQAACYQPWPAHTPSRAWIPVAGPAAAHYWRGAVRSTSVRRDQLRDAAGRVLAWLGVRSHLCVVALGPHASNVDTNADPFLLRAARQRTALIAGNADTERGDDRFLLLTPGKRSVGKIVALAFDSSGRPAVAVKTTRVSESAAALMREAELLDTVHAQHRGGMSGVPHVLFRAEMRGEPVIGESALTGTPLAALLNRRRYPEIAERVTAWLSLLAEPAVAAPAEPVWERLVAPTLERFEREFAQVLDPAQLRRTRELLRTLGPLPVVCEQRDFSPWNVFEGENGIVALDWESGEPRGLPALDLVYFFTHAAYYLEGAWTSGRFEAAYHSAWSRETSIGRINNSCVAAYLARLGLPMLVLGPLRLFAWVLHSHSDYVHRRVDAGGTPSRRALLESTFVRLYNAEIAGNMSC